MPRGFRAQLHVTILLSTEGGPVSKPPRLLFSFIWRHQCPLRMCPKKVHFRDSQTSHCVVNLASALARSCLHLVHEEPCYGEEPSSLRCFNACSRSSDGDWIRSKLQMTGWSVKLRAAMHARRHQISSYERVKGSSHTAEERASMHSHRPHATMQP